MGKKNAAATTAAKAKPKKPLTPVEVKETVVEKFETPLRSECLAKHTITIIRVEGDAIQDEGEITYYATSKLECLGWSKVAVAEFVQWDETVATTSDYDDPRLAVKDLIDGDLESLALPESHFTKPTQEDVERTKWIAEDLQKWLKAYLERPPKPNEHGVFTTYQTHAIPFSKSRKTKIEFHTVKGNDGLWHLGHEFSASSSGSGAGPSVDVTYGSERDALAEGVQRAISWLDSHSKTVSSASEKKRCAEAVRDVETWASKFIGPETAATTPSPVPLTNGTPVEGMPPGVSVTLLTMETPDGWKTGFTIHSENGLYSDVRPTIPGDGAMGESTEAEAILVAAAAARSSVETRLNSLKPNSAPAKLAAKVRDRLIEFAAGQRLLIRKDESSAPPDPPRLASAARSVDAAHVANVTPSVDDPEANYQSRLLAAQIEVGRASQAVEEARARLAKAKAECGLPSAQQTLREALKRMNATLAAGVERHPLFDKAKGGA